MPKPPLPGNAVEARRTLNTKTFEWTDGHGMKQRRVTAGLRPIHFWKDAQWNDLDPGWAKIGNRWEPEKVPYHVECTGPGVYQFTSDVGLRAVVDSGLTAAPSNRPTIDGALLLWEDVAPDLDVLMWLMPWGVSVDKILKGPLAPLTYTSTITLPVGPGLVVNADPQKGRDNFGRAIIPGRTALNQRRLLHLDYQTSEVDHGDGTRTITATTEILTDGGGNILVKRLNPTTHLLELTTEMAWPLELRT
jgi:hypothetical protein